MASDKQALRKAAEAARRTLSKEERAEKSAMIAERIVQSAAFQNARTVLVYYPVGAEVDVRSAAAAAKEAGKTVLYPYCPEKVRMTALFDQSAWGKDAYGIPCPEPETARVADPAQIDLVIVPCVGFDKDRHRIGMGAGIYDRYLPGCTRAAAIMAAYSAQRVADLIADPWDVIPDAVVTEDGWI